MSTTRPLDPHTRYRCLRCGRPGRLDTPCPCRHGPPVHHAVAALVLQVGTIGLLALLGVGACLLWGGRTP